MTEIEKARLDLKTSVSLLQLERGEHEAYRSERTVSTIEALIDAKLAEHANRIRAIAREEWRAEYRAAIDALNRVTDAEINAATEKGGDRNQLDRRQDREDKSPPAVEAPAAGALSPLGGITIRADEPNIVIEGFGRPDLSIGSELSDMTALARRLAEALVTARSWSSVMIKHADLEQIDEALAEARKHKLIE